MLTIIHTYSVDKLLHAYKSIFNFHIERLDITLLKINKCRSYKEQR